MKLGTIVYENQIYNLDYMTSEEVKQLLDTAESDKSSKMREEKNRLL